MDDASAARGFKGTAVTVAPAMGPLSPVTVPSRSTEGPVQLGNRNAPMRVLKSKLAFAA